jgi:precorrin isomerase/sirohydrochlorin ferrochelatase
MSPPVPVHPIEAESYRILAGRVDLSRFAPGPAAVIARVVHATADAELVDALVVPEAAVAAGTAALAAGAPVLCDVEMVRAGISGAQTHCHLAATPSAGDHPSRSAAAMAAGAARFADGAVVVVGCAPTALVEACRLIEAGELRPALVVGVPVGYVGAEEAKERLLALAQRRGVAAITLRGERGGAAVAAAIVNALVRRAANAPAPSEAPAALLIGHGTRSAEGEAELRELCAVVAAARPDLAVEAGFLEFMGPGVDEAIARLAARGARQVIAVPLVLLGAGHMKDDGPAALQRARAAHPEIAFSYARDLGVHPLVLGAVEARIKESQPADGPPDAVVVVGRGSTDPDANGDLAKVARLLADGRGLTAVPPSTDGNTDSGGAAPALGLVEPAFVSLARPGVTEALERCRQLGARRITVVPYFLCTGRLVVRLADQARTWAAKHPDVTVSLGAHIGVDERVVALVWSRYDEARGFDVTMNCDACLYRVALPGYEQRASVPAPRPSPVG